MPPAEKYSGADLYDGRRTEVDGRAVEPLRTQQVGVQRKRRIGFLFDADARVVLDHVGTAGVARIRRLEMTGEEVRVIHEITADQVVLVADAASCAATRRQQQPCVLDAAAGQHDGSGLYRHATSVERRHANAGHTITGAIDVDDIGIQIHVDIARCRQLIAVHRAKVAGVAELEDP